MFVCNFKQYLTDEVTKVQREVVLQLVGAELQMGPRLLAPKCTFDQAVRSGLRESGILSFPCVSLKIAVVAPASLVGFVSLFQESCFILFD